VVSDEPQPTDEKYLYFEMDDGYSYVHRRGERVTWLDYDTGMWLVAGHQELTEVLGDDETFSSLHHFPNGRTPFTGVMQPPTPVRAVPIEMDPPEYFSYRRSLAPRFGPAAVRKLTPYIGQYTDWCLDRVIESGESDLFNDLIKLVPAMVTLHLIGLPPQDAEIVANAVHRRGHDRFHMNPAWRHMFDHVSQAVKLRREEPADDLISYLVDVEIDGKKLTDLQIYEICFTVVVGGMSTTAKLLLGSLSYFGVHQDERQRVMDDPALLPTAIEEFVRYYSPVSFLTRTATKDVCVGEQQISRGDRVGMGFAAANRDPLAFDEPNEIQIDRKPNRHLAFGHGIHFCIGSNLGRTEAQLVINRVLERIPDYRLAAEYESIHELVGISEHPVPRTKWGERLDRGLPVTFTPGPCVGADIGPDFQLATLPA
jgi:cytochrome P450